jgi:hypothetical protein
MWIRRGFDCDAASVDFRVSLIAFGDVADTGQLQTLFRPSGPLRDDAGCADGISKHPVSGLAERFDAKIGAWSQVDGGRMPAADKKPFAVPDVTPEGTVRDFLLPIVEFLGILVPGLLFLLLALPAVAVPLTQAIEFVQSGSVGSRDAFTYVLDLVKSSSLGLAGIVLVSSYVAGHILFRQDPKIPDESSFKRVYPSQGESGPVRQCEAEIRYNEEKKIFPINKHNLEFPYRYLYEYLEDRGLEHLAALIPWRGKMPESYRLRTKHFINALKVRLEFVFPYQYTRIQRNEAHVRLMSSLWYATRALLVLSVAGAVVGIVPVAIVHVESGKWWPLPEVYGFISPILVFALSVVLKNQIEKFLHYQRIRELVFILEAVYFAEKLHPGMFDPITAKRPTEPPASAAA